MKIQDASLTINSAKGEPLDPSQIKLEEKQQQFELNR